METRRSNHLLGLSINRNQGATGRYSPAKELLKNRFFMAILGRMLFPHERIGGDGVEVVIVLGAERPEFDQLALQDRLIVKGHAIISVARAHQRRSEGYS